MAISLKKHTPGAGEQESARLNDVNSNWGTIEQAINDLQANASLLKHYNLTVTLANGVAMVYATDLGISDCTQWRWFVMMVHTTGAVMVYPSIQVVSAQIACYLRYGTGQVAPDGTYQINLLGIKI